MLRAVFPPAVREGAAVWDNARLLTRISNWLFGLAAVLVLYGAGRMLLNSAAFPLRTLQVNGELVHVAREEVVNALQGKVSGTFFTVELDAIRAAFESVPWVRRAEVRRLWPDRIEVRVEEHVPLARWGEASRGELVSVHGEVFTAALDAQLPVLHGPPGSEREVTARYARLREQFAALELAPVQLLLSQRHAWQLRLSNGLSLQLGRDSEKDPVQQRVARFIEAYPRTLAKLNRRIEYVDLRYPNGFALRVPELAHAQPAAKRSKRS
jgi:cell division protein FtsQ